MKHHPKFPEYVAVLPSAEIRQPIRTKVLGRQTEKLCFDCPGQECRKGPKVCPIEGIWLHIANVTKLRLAGYDVRLDTTEKTMEWKGD